MKRFFVLCTALVFAAVTTVGCDTKTNKFEKKETVKTPDGTTTTTDKHEVDSSGKNPPANSTGEKGENKGTTITTTTTKETKTP